MSGCATPGCKDEAALNGKLDGLCIPCYNEDYNRRYRPDNGGAISPWGYKKENDIMTKNSPAGKIAPSSAKEKIKFCKGCHRDKKDIGRLYKGLCAECRSKPEAESAPRRDTEPEDIPDAAVIPFDHLKEQKIDSSIGKALLEGMREAELRITLDFKDHPELLQKLAACAKKDFRLPDGQALAILDVYLNGAKNA